jgi:hypothetical protein
MTGVGTVRPHSDDYPSARPEPEIIYETGGEDIDRASTPALTQIMQEEDPFRREPPPPMPGYIPPSSSNDVSAVMSGAMVPQFLQPKPQQYSPPAGSLHNDHSPRPIPVDQPRTPSPPHATPEATPHSSTLLGPGVFRDTTFSGSTGWRSTGVDVPVTWFGASALDTRESQLDKHDSGVSLVGDDRERNQAPLTGPGPGAVFPGGFDPYSDTMPKFPGAFLPSVSERREQVSTPNSRGSGTPLAGRASPSVPKTASGYFTERGHRAGTPDSGAPRWKFPAPHQLDRHDVEARISTPYIADAFGATRKSEAGIVGHIPVQAGIMPELSGAKTPPAMSTRRRSVSGEGWVLVDVDTERKRPPNRPRSSSDSRLHRGASSSPVPASTPNGGIPRPTKMAYGFDMSDSRQASNQSLPVKEGGTIRRLFSLTKEPASGSRIRKPRASDAVRTFR